MTNEMHALEHNGTQELVLLPPGKKPRVVDWFMLLRLVLLVK